MTHDDRKGQIPMQTIRQEEGARELANSEEMEPYMNFAMALMRGTEATSELEALRRLPLQKRYVWRVVSALKWGFADFDDLSVSADVQTLTPQDRAEVVGLLKLRPMQFCLFLAALLGVKEMQQMMVEAIGATSQLIRDQNP